jgi:hypothetical protein
MDKIAGSAYTVKFASYGNAQTLSTGVNVIVVVVPVNKGGSNVFPISQLPGVPLSEKLGN